MQIERVITSKTTLRALTPQENFAGRNVMGQCMSVRPDEQILIVTDQSKLETEAAIFFEAAKQFSHNIKLIYFSGMTENAQEPPWELTEEMCNSNVVLLVTTYSLTHTRARERASQLGTRIASMPGITHEMIIRTLSIDYAEIAQLSKKIAARLTAGKNALLTAVNGTNVFFDLAGRTAIADTGLFTNPGDFGNLPAGEAFIAPREGKSEGIIVFDGCFANIILDRPIKILVEKGTVVDIQGGEAARLLNQRLSGIGKQGYNIAELGVGTNKMARLNSELLEVEKVFGTVHVALGNNATFGGEVDVPFHSDGVILKPSLQVDNKFVLKDGRFVM